MLSKIKSTIAESRSYLNHTSQASDNEEEVDNDTNNNNNNNPDNNQQQSKQTQDELLDIVEVSRQRRLSKDSADSLSSFIKWSFSHMEPTMQRIAGQYKVDRCATNENRPDKQQLDEGEEVPDDALQMHKERKRFHQNRLQADQLPPSSFGSAGGGSSAANLASLKGIEKHSGADLAQIDNGKGIKRARLQAYSPTESKHSQANQLNNIHVQRKSSSYLGNVVDRLHQQHQPLPNPVAQQEAHRDELLEMDTSSTVGLSFHLQQFLQQQTSLEDLCSSVGLDDSNQLVLAAAIHRALVDSVGPSQLPAGPLDSKSTGSSTGSSSGHTNPTSDHLNSSALSAAVGSDLHLVDSLSRQRRVYNTRAALHGIAPQNRQTVALNMSNRMQQQRHAQAAAALSALAGAGQHPLPLPLPLQLTGPSPTTPIVDFKCDTCPSSFDDRHRLMQHQSIHLELKKDWFTETPVDEVMKIFNRRRGEFLCNICNLRFEATLDYDQHNHSVHGPRPYCCQFCGNGTRTFKCWRQYLNHLYDHRYVFSCTIDDCDFTVNRRDSLRFHIFRFHLNCQLPQGQHQQHQLRSGHDPMLAANNINGDSKWPAIEHEDEDDEDTENEMNVAD